MAIRDQVITNIMAEALQADAARALVQSAWIIMRNQPDHPGKFIGRFATEHPTIYILRADSLPALRQLLPSGLRRSERQPADPPEVVEIWVSEP